MSSPSASNAPKQRRFWRSALVLGLAAVLVAETISAEDLSGQSFREITPELQHAVARGFKYLLRQQKETNSFRNDSNPVAINALVGIALLAGGHTEQEGRRKEYVLALKDCTATLLSYQEKNGYFKQDRMYGHGFATLFLAELYGVDGGHDAKVRDALSRAIRVIEGAQRAEGGWDYSPRLGRDANRIAGSDTSITVCQTMALRAARNLGVEVDQRVVDAAKRYIIGAQNKDGGFRYRAGNYLTSSSAFPRSAAGVCILYSLGEYSSPTVRSGVRYLERHYQENNNFPFYAQYYCSQAMFQVRGRLWKDYFTWARARLLKRQKLDGAWRSNLLELEKNPNQTTAMALIVLQLPYRLLPILER